MLQSLPAETVFEAKQRAKRDTVLLFVLLLAIYIFFFNLLAIIGYAMLKLKLTGSMKMDFWPVNLGATALAILVGLTHFFTTTSKSLDQILQKFTVKPTDPEDTYHSRFVNIVHEAEAATGVRPIRPLIIPCTGSNAFAVEDWKDKGAIGVTEGLLAKLDRSELSAVVAHEAAHLVNNDSKLTTTACSLFGIFAGISSGVGTLAIAGAGRRSYGYSRRRGSGGAVVITLVLWIIATIGYFMTKFVFMCISRKREFLADAHAVQMCKDPLSLAEALNKISGGYRGRNDLPEGYSSLFILNPQISNLDETRGLASNLFSTHPPMAERLKRLMNWAKADLSVLKKARPKEVKQEKDTGDEKREASKFFANQEGNWKGPFTPTQLLTMGLMTPSTWVCPAGSESVTRAGDIPLLLPLFEKQVSEKVAKERCPRCKVPFVQKQYEGAPVLHCTFCNGNLLKTGVLERIIARREKEFSASEIEETKLWRKSRKGRINELEEFPNIKCPLCQYNMAKSFHSSFTTVIIDRCMKCGAVWCDGKELETIQILVEEVSSRH